MRYRLEGTTIEAIDTYVRITLGNGKCAVTERRCPKQIEVCTLLEQMQGYGLNLAQRQICARAADDARNNKIELVL